MEKRGEVWSNVIHYFFITSIENYLLSIISSTHQEKVSKTGQDTVKAMPISTLLWICTNYRFATISTANNYSFL